MQVLVVEPTPLRVFYPAALLCLLSNFCRVSHLERFVMALFNDALKGLGVTALVGIGVVLAAPLLFPATAPALRPLAKGLIKGYLAVADRMKEVMAEAGEQLSDLVAEARAEYTAGAAVSATTPEHRISTPAET